MADERAEAFASELTIVATAVATHPESVDESDADETEEPE